MLSRLVWGALVAGAVAGPCFAESLNPEQARQFIAGKVFAFTCVDGTRGAGRIQHDGSVAGSIQFSGSGPVRHARLPVNTIQVGATQVCASLKGLPFTPCFNIDKTSEGTFRGSVQGMSSFAWCEFRKHGNSLLVARAERGPMSLRARGVRSADASKPEAAKAETVSKVETPKVESAKIDPPKVEPAALELRRSTQ
jgi:hypothetical protein